MSASLDQTLDKALDQLYAGDIVDPTATPIKNDRWQALDFSDPAECFLFFNSNFSVSSGQLLHSWQIDIHEALAACKPTDKAPLKICLRAANGSGKDSIIIAGFVVWFILCKIQARAIITSSSGTQLTSQTENAIRNMCENVNKMFGCEYIRIRQRYYKCRGSGSEIRLFATDEAGKAEGYHPMVPGAEMAIIVSEGKSVNDEIHQALRRCTGYNYWIEVSTPGASKGFFYKIANDWLNVELKDIPKVITKPGNYSIRVTSYDCSHLPIGDIEEDKKDFGEHSAIFRSKHLALFTSLDGEYVIPMELVEQLQKNPPAYNIIGWEDRVGIDLAAGGDENVVTITNGNKVKLEKWFRETDTTITATKIEQILKDAGIDKKHKYIYADDGGIGHSIIDMLVRDGWSINRVLNQWPAFNKKQYGNRGAENWYRVKRFFEEGLLDIRGLSDKTLKQISSRRYKQGSSGARIFLERKSEAKSNGDESPDRADAYILSLSGLTQDRFAEAKTSDKPTLKGLKEGEVTFKTNEEYQTWYEDNYTFGYTRGINMADKVRSSGKRIFNSLREAVRKNAPL